MSCVQVPVLTNLGNKEQVISPDFIFLPKKKMGLCTLSLTCLPNSLSEKTFTVQWFCSSFITTSKILNKMQCQPPEALKSSEEMQITECNLACMTPNPWKHYGRACVPVSALRIAQIIYKRDPRGQADKLLGRCSPDTGKQSLRDSGPERPECARCRSEWPDRGRLLVLREQGRAWAHTWVRPGCEEKVNNRHSALPHGWLPYILAWSPM